MRPLLEGENENPGILAAHRRTLDRKSADWFVPFMPRESLKPGHLWAFNMVAGDPIINLLGERKEKKVGGNGKLINKRF